MTWSYSSLNAWEQCPRRYHLTRIAKVISEPQAEATLHGNEVHKALENAVGKALPLPEKYKQYIPIVELVRKAPGVKKAEHKFGLTSSFTPTDFWAKDVWCRGVLDLQVVTSDTVVVCDYKTGKPKVDADQLKLFAAAAFALHPRVNTVKTGYIWLAYGKLDTETFHRGDEAGIWQEFIPRVRAMDDAIARKEYVPKPSGLCRAHCPIPRRMCEFSGKE